MTRYRGPIVDPHQHFWLPDETRYPSFREGDPLLGPTGVAAQLRRSILPEDYILAIGDLPIVASVHIEAGYAPDRDPVEETRWVLDLERPPGFAAALVGGAAFETPAGVGHVDRQAEVPGMAGIRQNLRRSDLPSDASQVEGAEWRASLDALEQNGLVLELFADIHHVEVIAALADRRPELTIVVDHCINPGHAIGGGAETWRRALDTLAARPNVVIKVSSVQAHLVGAGVAPTDAVVREICSAMIERFGPARAMIASDYPLSELAGGFGEIYQQVLRITDDLSESDQRDIFAETAARVYRLPSGIVT